MDTSCPNVPTGTLQTVGFALELGEVALIHGLFEVIKNHEQAHGLELRQHAVVDLALAAELANGLFDVKGVLS